VGKVLALDVGERRVGVAISDESGRLARPLTTIARASKREDFAAIARLIEENGVDRVIVGLPRTLRGEEGAQAGRVRRYAEALSATIAAPIAFQDERFTSIEAEERLAASSRKRRVKGEIDAAAAAIILQDYLNQQHTPSGD
jgi:putative Holliday junction resolvase